MMQITVDITSLTKEQREHVSGFILTYPVASAKSEVTLELNLDTTAAHKSIDALIERAATLDPADDPSVGAPSPVEAFGDPVEQAFGGAPVPLPLGATAAPFTAVASQSPTVPAVPSVIGVNIPTAPLPPAPPAAPLATIVAPTEATPVPVDKDGLPWDARIHSSNKKTIADGTWQKRRGVDPALVVTVESELRKLMGATSITATVVPPVEAWPFPTPNAAPTEFVQLAAPALTAPPSPAADPKTEWVNLIRESTAAQAAGKIKAEEVSAICQGHGVPALPLLMNRLDLVSAVAADIRALIASR